MKKHLIVLFAAFALFAAFGLSSKAIADEPSSASFIPIASPTPFAEIVRVELDKSEVLIPCPPIITNGYPGNSPCFQYNNGLVEVKTIVDNPRKIPLTYLYAVSGGRIIGDGESAGWHLSGVRPGVYTVTVSIKGKGAVSEQTRKQQITIRECDCPFPCVCPILDVTDSGNLRAGENATFTAIVTGGSDTTGLVYKWSVSQGEIVEGQGTPKVTVKTTPNMTGKIEGRVEVTGPGLCETCRELIDMETVMFIK